MEHKNGQEGCIYPIKYAPNYAVLCFVMVSEILVNTGSGNGLVPDGTKPLPEPMLTSPW